jgi:hypothetical protein
MRVFLHNIAGTGFAAKLRLLIIIRVLLRDELGASADFNLSPDGREPGDHRVGVIKDHQKAARHPPCV